MISEKPTKAAEFPHVVPSEFKQKSEIRNQENKVAQCQK